MLWFLIDRHNGRRKQAHTEGTWLHHARYIYNLWREDARVLGHGVGVLNVVVVSPRAGEFEKHAGCWMGWPYDGNLWRDNAKPAQAQYAAIAKAISEFEPLTMFAHPGEVTKQIIPIHCSNLLIVMVENWPNACA